MTEQRSLFSVSEDWQLNYRTYAQPVSISATALEDWKQRVYRFQQDLLTGETHRQGTLFDLPASQAFDQEADQIDPFQLKQQNTEFWRWRVDDAGVAALYFVIDYELPILLYVGETVKSNQRWKGEHDCKRYLINYRQAHSQLQLPTALGIGFWPHAPVERKPRQQLEAQLIRKWRSPFNKENWHLWGTPFVSET